MNVAIEEDLRPKGELSMRVIKGSGPELEGHMPLRLIHEFGMPHPNLPAEVNRWRNDNSKRLPFLKGVRDAMLARAGDRLGLAHIEGALFGKIIRADGDEIDLGLMGLNIVTTAGVNFIGDCFRGTVEPEIMKYHGLGTGATAEVIGNTALQTELTTQYNPDNTRATGSLAGTNNVFTTVGTNTVDASVSPTEWGLLSQAATGGGTLLDRVTFTAVALGSGDSLQTTFNLTFTAGG